VGVDPNTPGIKELILNPEVSPDDARTIGGQILTQQRFTERRQTGAVEDELKAVDDRMADLEDWSRMMGVNLDKEPPENASEQWKASYQQYRILKQQKESLSNEYRSLLQGGGAPPALKDSYTAPDGTPVSQQEILATARNRNMSAQEVIQALNLQ